MSASSTRRILLARRFAETLAYAAIGSAALGVAGLPAGWLSGAIVGVSAAALSGRPVFVPPQVGRAVYVILGISLGSSVTPETVATMVTWPLSMLALTIAMIAITTSVMAYLKFVHGWDTLSALFAAADQVFANVLQNLFDFDPRSILTHTFFIGFWGALTAGLLRWGLIGRPIAAPRLEYVPASVTPFAVALGLLDALFLLFVVIQLRYFFGGAALVEQTGGVTYAEYARAGFFELVTASALVLPIVGSH